MDQIPNDQVMANSAAAEHGQSQQIEEKVGKVEEQSQPVILSNSTFKGIIAIQEKLKELEKEYPQGLPYEPQSFSGESETHLNIDNLLEDDKEKRERANYFVCAICAMVVKNAQECDSCQSLFCSDCIAPWQQNNDSCPKKCKGNNAVEFRPMHRYVKQDLLSLKFKCPIPECKFAGTYEEALKHHSECEFQFIPCKLGCGMGIVGKDMEFHCMKQCKYFKITCENCGEEVYPNDPEQGGQGIEGHDCVQILKANLKKAREEITRLQGGGAPQLGAPFGFQFLGGAGAAQGQELIVYSANNRVMQKQRGNPVIYGGGASCDCCGQSELQNYEYFYHCPIDHYDMCKVCALKQARVLRTNDEGKILLRGHGNPMRYEPNGDRHMGAHNCDGPRLLGNNARCQSSIGYNLANKNQQYIWDDYANIDVCICCAEALMRR